jgi:D-beta-D-heptose 7-phosphate kinase/D-beta-D-heptose 1-phosphate adenosyltransferase
MINRESIDLVRNCFCQQRALVIGDLMLDEYLFGEVRRISPEAPVPVISITRRDYRAGGAGNVARNLAALGLDVGVAGFLGEDDAGSELRRLLQEDGIQTDGILALDTGKHTITKTRLIAGNQQIVRYDREQGSTPAAAEHARLSQLVNKLLADLPAIIILSDYAKGTLNHALCQQIISAATLQSCLVYVDPKGSDYSRYRGASAITPNLKELGELMVASGQQDSSEQAFAQQQLAALDLERLIVTKGAAGMEAITKTDILQSPAKARAVFDVSGAGDTAIAVLAACHACGMNLRDTLGVANAASGIAVQKIGAVAVHHNELLEALERATGSRLAGALGLDELLNQVSLWRQGGDQIVFTNGCFDMLHAGHIKLLHAAAEQGSRLIVAMNSDYSTQQLKGEGRPFVSQEDRAALVAALSCVDAVTLFDAPDPLALIKAIGPDVLVKGADYRAEEIVGYQQVTEKGGRVLVIPLAEGLSTSSQAEKIHQHLAGKLEKTADSKGDQ